MYNVLLVDPNDTTLRLIKNVIERSDINFKITTHSNQFHGVTQLIEKQQFSLIVININGYNSTGIILCRKIRSVSRIPIILIGGKDNFQLARKALTYQVNDYLCGSLCENALKNSLSAITKTLTNYHTTEFSPFAADAVATTTIKHEPHSSIIETVKHYVRNEMHRNITLKQIASLLHFNCAYLGQKFRVHENMSFKEYLLQQRMEKAKVLLKKTDMKIYQIANEVGYTEIDWFYKKFKQYTGLSSIEYRKKNMKISS